MSDNVLEFNNVSFKWENGLEFKDMSFGITRGEFLLIKGPSGSGKSTILRLICRLEEINSGEILLNGGNISAMPPMALRRKAALIQQTPSVIRDSIKYNLLLPFSFVINKDLKVPSKDELQKKLEELSLDVPLDKDAETLSVGQKQRLCILRTLLLEPEVLLMDEPTSALDKESRQIVEGITEYLNKQGKTILMINHSEYIPNVKHSTLIVKNGKVSKEI